MKNRVIVLLSIGVLASCSAPRYSYYFDHHTYPVRKNPTAVEPASPSDVSTRLSASVTKESVTLPETQTVASPVSQKALLTLTKTERKVLRHQLRSAIRNYPVVRKELNSAQTVKASEMDHDLKLAIIFGAVGIVALVIPGTVFYIIGAIALLIGVVFFVKWIIRQ